MEVVDYELFEVPPRWLFLRLETSDGLVGWGEPVVEGRSRTVRTAVTELLDTYLLGRNPLHIEDHWQHMYRGGFYRGGPVLMSAIAGIDQALWDIKGKHYDTPVYDLLGGKMRDRVRVYQSIDGETPEEFGSAATEMVDEGFTALKLNVTSAVRHVDSPDVIDAAEARLRAVREAVGPGVDVGIDLHGRLSKSMAKRLVPVLEEYDPMFYEEPVLPEHNDALPTIAEQTTVPIATGERMYSRWDFKSLLQNNCVDIVQPDPSHAGGITEVTKIATMAEAYDVALAPHCPLGPIALATCVQLDAHAPNALIQEQSLNVHYHDGNHVLEYLSDPDVFSFEDGYFSLPSESGLGVDIDEEHVREQAQQDVNWQTPVWHYDDGSIAEW